MHRAKHLPSMYQWHKYLLIAAFSLCCINQSRADGAAHGADGSMHQVVEGDTLIGLAKKYLDDAELWPLFLQYNKVENPRRLKPGSTLRIPPVELPRINVIFKHGEVSRVVNGDPGSAPLDVGDQLQEGDKVMVGSDSYLTLQFNDGSIIRALPDSVLSVQRYRGVDPTKPGSRIMALERGDLDITVIPEKPAGKSGKTKPKHFEIMTPRAIAAVRGTRFDVSASETNTTSGVTEGRVAIRQAAADKRARQAVLNPGTGIRVNEAGKLGQVRTLLAAADLSGLPAQLDRSDYVVLDWPDITDAASYQVRMAADTEMNEVVAHSETNSSSARFTNLADGEYTVGIRAVDAEGIIGFEAEHTVNIQAQPAPPFYLGPDYQQTVGGTVKLDCTPVVGAIAYRLQVSRSADFSSPAVDTDPLENCHLSPGQLEDGAYYWRAAAIAQDADGQFKQGPFSLPSQFNVDSSVNTAARDNPSAIHWIEDRDLRFTAQVSAYEDFSDILKEEELDSHQLSLENLAAGLYFIRLKATDSEGFITAYSPPRMVEIRQVIDTIERNWADQPK